MDTEDEKTENSNIQFGVTNHYNQYKGFEVIDVCEQLRAPDGSGGFNRGNAFKYLARAGYKDPNKHIEDLEKAKNYIQREIDRLKAESKQEDAPALKLVSDGHWLEETTKSSVEDRPKLPLYCTNCGYRIRTH